MILTESELREMWRDGKNALPAFPPGTSFTPSAWDFLRAHQLIPQFSGSTAAHPTADVPLTPAAPVEPTARPAWDKPAAFPVVLGGPLPICSECGQPLPHKPEHMTQLDAGHFAPKTHPRIKLRGQIDSLHALVMLASAQARERQALALAERLDSLAAYCREIQSAEYHARPVAPLSLDGKSAEEIHAISHHPERYLGRQHLAPGPQDGVLLHWLNYLRAETRRIEIVSLEVYPPPARQDLCEALNRLSSAVYYLELTLI